MRFDNLVLHIVRPYFAQLMTIAYRVDAPSYDG